MKKNNRKLGVPANAKKVAERAMSRIVERKKRHRRHGKRGSGWKEQRRSWELPYGKSRCCICKQPRDWGHSSVCKKLYASAPGDRQRV